VCSVAARIGVAFLGISRSVKFQCRMKCAGAWPPCSASNDVNVSSSASLLAEPICNTWSPSSKSPDRDPSPCKVAEAQRPGFRDRKLRSLLLRNCLTPAAECEVMEAPLEYNSNDASSYCSHLSATLNCTEALRPPLDKANFTSSNEKRFNSKGRPA